MEAHPEHAKTLFFGAASHGTTTLRKKFAKFGDKKKVNALK